MIANLQAHYGFSRMPFGAAVPVEALYASAAHKEVEDRQFGVVNIQPGFQQGSSGLEAARK